MIVIDDSPREATGARDGADAIRVSDLLASCAAEAGRLAAAVDRLDASMGAMLSDLARPPDAAEAGDAPVRILTRDLQETDRIRQELAGLARALELAATARSMSALLPAAQVRACTPLGALRNRLLSHSAAGPQDGTDQPEGG